MSIHLGVESRLGSFTKKENEILMALVSDCVNYGLSESEALSYIKTRLGREVSAETYYRRKKQVDPGRYASEWLSYFSKIGFAVKHMQIIEMIEMVQKDTIKDYLSERDTPQELRNSGEIQRLRYEIRENCKLLQDLSLGTPIIAQIKAKIENVERRESNL